ncbi:hypothetical protein Bpfe_000584, partial [Biomphalaria pfeifferi]
MICPNQHRYLSQLTLPWFVLPASISVTASTVMICPNQHRYLSQLTLPLIVLPASISATASTAIT